VTEEKTYAIVTGNPIDGFKFFGPVPLSCTRTDGYTRAVEDESLEWWQAELRPLQQMVDGPVADEIEAKIAAETAGLPRPPVYFTTHNGDGKAVCSYGIIDRELIEAHDPLPDGSPDWDNGSICDEVRGDADFYFPAVGLLKFLDSSSNEAPSWHYIDRRRVVEELDRFVSAGLIRAYRPHEMSGGYTVIPHGDANEWTLRTPAEADAYTAALAAVLHSPVIAHVAQALSGGGR
jgi:hypothetical protein